ncbi:3'-5' exonuclease [Desulfoprunum benzoelyticum]|uniref:DNA polymerase III epsilon subunit-like protein n=1 Tax=Desulfoprunum benzoelyticum TaxID=1506996 RepID=A0A840UTR2_9BACT|nr:3'-5' exonuclease [Desulfoprunum benzoelyticum]MBB5349577.1 DNA polymerase III epsilon subunit-like protein [Desulfoprunum benzoelyticum]MBM9531333.1 3'-5' exonuclease [Desulfoprunum benzoelyticum]
MLIEEWIQKELLSFDMSDTCCKWLAADPLFLDTETTGLNENAEIVELAVVNVRGEVLVDTLIKPVNPIPEEVSLLHGITNEMVDDAPCWRDVYLEVVPFLTGRLILSYNAAFDSRIIDQSCRLYRLPPPSADWRCVMQMYKDHTHNHKFVKLSSAAADCQVTVPNQIHRALADTLLCLGIVRYIGTGTAQTLTM